MDFDFSIQCENGILDIALQGKLDAANAPRLMEALNAYIGQNISAVIFDFTDLKYIASAGLRVILMAKQKIGKDLTVTVKYPNDEVMSVLEMTGFISFLEVVNQ